MATYKSVKDLNKYLQKEINDVLDKKISKLVKEDIQTGVSVEVYSVYKPRVYKRRGAMGDNYTMGNPIGTGSLGDVEQMNHEVSKDGVLTITNDAKKNPDYPDNRYGYDDSKSLAENIEYGYGDKHLPFNKPRPFMEDARNTLKENDNIIESLKEGLEDKGFKID